jgi:hypothetical protein
MKDKALLPCEYCEYRWYFVYNSPWVALGMVGVIEGEL